MSPEVPFKIKNTIGLAFLSCAVLLICTSCGKTNQAKGEKPEFEIDKVYERGPLTVHVRLDKNKMTIAETVLLELEAAIEPDYEVQMPKVDKVLESFGIVDWNNLGDKLDENNNVVSRYQYRLEPFLSGNYAIPAFTFEFHRVGSTASDAVHDANEVEGKSYELSTEPIDIEVTSLLDEQRVELAIADIEDVVAMSQKASFWWLWTIVGGGVIAAVGGWLYFRRKRADRLVRIFKPAHELAYNRLRALVKEDLINKGRVKEFYEHISDILRHYIEHRFDLRAPERTTEEFLIELQFTDVLTASDKKGLGEFLSHCDLVKFAKHNPTEQQIQRTFDLAKDFIEKTKSDERKVDITDEVEMEEAVEVGSI